MPQFNFEISKTAVQDAGCHLAEIRSLLEKPAGFSKLTSSQRKFVISALLASVVPADRKIKDCEMELLHKYLHSRIQPGAQTLSESLAIAQNSLCKSDDVKSVAAKLSDLFGIDDRCALIGMMWDLALCDHELHASEEKLIFHIADEAGVPRKKVIDEQSRAASRAQ